MSIITISSWLQKQHEFLYTSGITTPRLDTLVLLADELDKDKSWVLAHPEYILQNEQVERLNTKIAQRANHVPLAYIRGYVEFYGRDFIVDENVLVPRPESESMIELLKNFVADEARLNLHKERTGPEKHFLTIVDIGTGSGCLGITAKLEISGVEVITTDISARALKVTRINAERLGVEITTRQGDLLAPICRLFPVIGPVVILANLPYVPRNYLVNQATKHEPGIALFSDHDGLSHYERLFSQVDELTTRPACIITEALPEQHAPLSLIAKKSGYYCHETDDLAQCFVANLMH